MLDKVKEVYHYVVDKIKNLLDKILDHEFIAGLLLGFIIGVIL